MKIKRALVSVSDKTGIVPFCKALSEFGVEILSTGGTARLLADNDVPITEVSEYTQFPEMMGGRVKTLHPKIHGALLGRRGLDDAVMRTHGIEPIDLLLVNLYPFEQAISQLDCCLAEAIEHIDIGGPAMLRSAAKNYLSVAVITDIEDYDKILEELGDNEVALSLVTRFKLAQKVFAHTANYDANIANYLGMLDEVGHRTDYPLSYTVQFHKKQALRYGENPHQSAAFYTEKQPAAGTLAYADLLQGKPLSYNNIVDADAALECVLTFPDPACVIVKHSNPCGVAIGRTPLDAYQAAYATDPVSAFGGVIAFNRPFDQEMAGLIIEQQFVELIIAPVVDAKALEIVAAKQGSARVMACGKRQQAIPGLALKRVSGGLLVQDNDLGMVDRGDMQVVTGRKPSDAEDQDLLFAWRVVKHCKSNAIVYCKAQRTLGVGAGQMSRIYSARIAAIKAQDEHLSIMGSVMASDAFFPFRDTIDFAASLGVRAVIQPGGSRRDQEVIAAADEHDMAMLFTSMRHFLH